MNQPSQSKMNIRFIHECESDKINIDIEIEL